jgi:hypothetical protein
MADSKFKTHRRRISARVSDVTRPIFTEAKKCFKQKSFENNVTHILCPFLVSWVVLFPGHSNKCDVMSTFPDLLTAVLKTLITSRKKKNNRNKSLSLDFLKMRSVLFLISFSTAIKKLTDTVISVKSYTICI